MRTIYFKNGTTKEITQEIANIIRDKVTKGCNQFQCFSIEDDLELIVNIQEIVYVA